MSHGVPRLLEYPDLRSPSRRPLPRRFGTDLPLLRKVRSSSTHWFVYPTLLYSYLPVRDNATPLPLPANASPSPQSSPLPLSATSRDPTVLVRRVRTPSKANGSRNTGTLPFTLKSDVDSPASTSLAVPPLTRPSSVSPSN